MKKKRLIKITNTIIIAVFIIGYGQLIKIANLSIITKNPIKKFAEISEYPINFIFTGLRDIKKLKENFYFQYILTPTKPLISEKINAKRFKKYNPKFTFNYEPNANQNSGFLILSAVNPVNGDPFVELWDLNKQNKLYRYDVSRIEILKELNMNSNLLSKIRLIHPLILPDLSFIAMVGRGEAIIKIDKCGKIINWNKGYGFHHSIEKDSNENIYAPISYFPDEKYYKNYGYDSRKKFRNEGFAILDQELNIKEIYSMGDILRKAGLLEDAMSSLHPISNPFHINDVVPLISEESGDKAVYLSLRHYGLLAYNIDKKKLIWVIKGATDFQHDINILDQTGEAITIFDNGKRDIKSPHDFSNNSFLKISNLPNLNSHEKTKYFLGRDLKSQGLDIIRYDFKNLPESLRPKTATQGHGKFSSNESKLFIEEADHGRLFEIDMKTKKFLWTYVNKSEKNSTPFFISWSRRIENLPFKVNSIEKDKCKNI